MADKKISQLNARQLLAGTDVFPVVATGSIETNKASLNDLKNNFIFPLISGNAGRFLKTDGTSIFWDDPEPGTLDEVLTAGNVSDNEIILNGGINGDLIIDGNDTFVGGVPTLLIRNLTTNQNHRLLIDRSIYNNNSHQIDIVAPTLTASRVLNYPNASGTFVLSVNGISADSSGNVNIPGGGGSVALNDLTDVIISTPTNGQALIFDSVAGQWKNQTIPSGSTGTLQQVTDNGNATTNDIIVSQTFTSGGIPVIEQTKISKNLIELFNDVNGTIFDKTSINSLGFVVENVGGDLSELGAAGFNFVRSGFSTTLNTNSNPTSNNNLFLPEASGTLVAKVNGVSADNQGNVVINTGSTTLDGLTDVIISTPTNGQVLTFNSVSGQWQNQTIPGASTPTLQQVTTAGNTTTDDIVLNDAGISGIDFLDFDLTPPTTANQEGRVQWNDDLKTIQIDTENVGVQINVGHETIQRVRNVSGSTIQKGKICFINGSSGNRPTIQLSDNSSDATSAQTIGFVAADIANGSNGYLITNGIIENVSTIGFPAGTQLFLSSNGNFQSTFPVQPLHNVRVGIVIDGNSPNGSIFVNILNGYEIDELHDCLISSPTNDQVLTYESASGLWKNKNVPAELPSQTGQSGKFLSTDGTAASWQTPTTPTLQQVATAGAQSTLTLRVSDSVVGTIQESIISPSSIIQKNTSTAAETQIAANDIRFIRSGFVTNIKANELVPATGTLTLPNGSGTLVKSVNGNSPDANGNVVVSGGGGSVALNDLTDVTIATPTAGQSLVFNSVSSQWENVKVGLPWTIDFGFTSFNLAASETYVAGLYYGAQPSTLINNRPSRKAVIQKTGFLKNVQVLTAMSAAAGSGNMILTFVNETQGTSQIISSTYGISSISLSSLSRLDLFQGFNFAVNVGDIVQMRIQTPAWSTLPTGVSMQFVTLFES